MIRIFTKVAFSEADKRIRKLNIDILNTGIISFPSCGWLFVDKFKFSLVLLF